MANTFLDTEGSLPEECRVSGWSRWRATKRIVAASLALVACCIAWISVTVAYSGKQAPKQASRSFDIERRLQAALPGTAGAPAATVEGFQQPPQISNALNAYFNMNIGPPVRHQPGMEVQATCSDNEELFQNLCYKTCAELTNGSFPLRTSAWTCCQAQKITGCFIQNQDHNMGLCSGYDVDGAGSCPHPPGQCLPSEELFGGECYQKCGILTGGTHPHRTSAFSCCDVKSTLACLQPSHFMMSSGYTVGGTKAETTQPHQPGQPMPLARRLRAPK